MAHAGDLSVPYTSDRGNTGSFIPADSQSQYHRAATAKLIFHGVQKCIQAAPEGMDGHRDIFLIYRSLCVWSFR